MRREKSKRSSHGDGEFVTAEVGSVIDEHPCAVPLLLAGQLSSARSLLPHSREGSGGAEVCCPRGAHRSQCGNGCPEGWEPAGHRSAKLVPVNHELGETVHGKDVPCMSGVELSCERLEQ